MYDWDIVEIVSKFNYLGITFTTVGSFAATYGALYCNALKSLYNLKSYLAKFTYISVSFSRIVREGP